MLIFWEGDLLRTAMGSGHLEKDRRYQASSFSDNVLSTP